ncbi:MAG: NfeD family protein [Thermoguttaceae bacterium]|jgi:membrane-bound serine protease (ClpP class)
MRWFSWLALAGFCLGAAARAADEPPPARFSRAVLIRFEGAITPRTAKYLLRKLETARSQGADLVIVEIDSPGGYLQESEDIAGELRDVDWAHTVAYVPREALSGAAIAALGCDEILLGRNALLGDAGAIFRDENFLFHYAPEKFRTDLARRVRDFAQAKGRPPALAEAWVDMNLPVYRYCNTKTGKIAYMSERDQESAAAPDDWKKENRVDGTGGGRFFEANGVQLADLGFSQGIVKDRKELFARYGVAPEDVVVLEPTAVDITVQILNLGIVTGLLVFLGLLGLFLEFMWPGTAVGGLLAAFCFALFFWSHLLGGTAGWLAMVFFLVGVAFVGVELFLVPGSMLAGVSGAVLILLGLIMASQNFLVPHTTRELSTLSDNLLMIFLSGMAFVIAAVVVSRRFGTLPLLGRFTLPPPDAAVDTPGRSAAAEPFELAAAQVVQVGDVGTAHSLLRPGGKARFGNRYVDVVTDGSFIAQGTPVKIVRIEGNLVVVDEAEA